MYAYANLIIECKDVWAVPIAATTQRGEQKCIDLDEAGRAVMTPVQTGIDDGKFIELYHKQVNGKWVNFDGSEQLILGELSELADGEKVDVETGPKR